MHALRIAALASVLALVALPAHADVMRGEPPADEVAQATPSATTEPERPPATTEPAKLTKTEAPEPAKPSSATPASTAPASSGGCTYRALTGNFFGAFVVSSALLWAFGRRRSRASARV